ncbi:MAG: DegQ family serine endoprotease [Rhodobacteraceae bacterium]|nr:MAG: DegQ family serine endoprotease [Paracoccaceae bacterium]
MGATGVCTRKPRKIRHGAVRAPQSALDELREDVRRLTRAAPAYSGEPTVTDRLARFPVARALGAGVLALALAAGDLTPATARSGAPESFADLAESLSPAVVNISTSQNVGRAGPEMPDLPPGAPFGDLFRDFFERNQRGPRRVSSLGSGFIIDPSGFIVTNNHVIDGADEIVVNFADGESAPAELVGRDPKTDIALLKIETSEPLPHVPFGDSDAMRVGDWVVAIGNPFGLGGSVSAGIVSARNRDINAGPYDDFIQTDAAINRGNSGGPLFNLAGEVIGVNTAIISPTGGSIGIGFAVPSDLVKTVVAQLREYGETRRGWLGVRIQTVTPELAESLELERPSGALVADVTAGGPAADAGIRSGDVILRFNGRRIDQMRELPRVVADTPVGSTVDVEVWRRGAVEMVSVEVGRLDEGEVVTASVRDDAEEGADGDTASVLGMALEPLTETRRGELGLGDEVRGVLVARVESDSPAGSKGVRPGDVIVEVAQESVSTTGDVVALVDQARGDGRASVLLLLQNGEEMRFVALSLAD